MSIWTPEELVLLNKAVRSKEHVTITNLIKLYQQRTNATMLKNSHPSLVAVQENNSDLLQYFLSNQPIDSKTINNCIEISLVTNHLEVFKALFARENQLNLGINPNNSIPVSQSLFREAFDQFVDKISILHQTIRLAKKFKDYKILEFLLSLPNHIVDQPFAHKRLQNCTELLLACLKSPQEPRDINVIRLLLKYGADPYLRVNNNGTSFTIISFIEDELRENPRDPEANEIMSLIQTELKHRGSRERDSSPEHSSSSTLSSPRSTTGSFSSSPKDGSPNGTPPSYSVMPDSPPRVSSSSSVSSASSSPNGSPPRDATEQTAKSEFKYTINKALPKDKFEKTFYIRIHPDTPLDHLKDYYFSGIKLDWYHPSKGDNAFHFAVETEFFAIAEAMLSWGVSVNILDLFGRNIIQRIAKSSRELEDQWMDIERLEFIFKDRPHLKQKPEINYQDKEGNTALHLAAVKGANEVVAFLLKHGADPSITNGARLTAEQYADKCQNPEKRAAIKKLLQSSGLRNGQSIANKPAEIQYHAAAQPAFSYSNSNSSMMFQGSRASASTPVSITTRSSPQQVGAIFTNPPLSVAQLPKPFKKADVVIEPPAVIPRDVKQSASKSNLLKNILGK